MEQLKGAVSGGRGGRGGRGRKKGGKKGIKDTKDILVGQGEMAATAHEYHCSCT